MKRALRSLCAKTTRRYASTISRPHSNPRTGYCLPVLTSVWTIRGYNKRVYTRDAATLVAESVVLSMRLSKKQCRPPALLLNHQFRTDRGAQCSLRFWNAIKAMAPKLVPFFESDCKKAYPQYVNTEFARSAVQSARCFYWQRLRLFE